MSTPSINNNLKTEGNYAPVPKDSEKKAEDPKVNAVKNRTLKRNEVAFRDLQRLMSQEYTSVQELNKEEEEETSSIYAPANEWINDNDDEEIASQNEYKTVDGKVQHRTLLRQPSENAIPKEDSSYGLTPKIVSESSSEQKKPTYAYADTSSKTPPDYAYVNTKPNVPQENGAENKKSYAMTPNLQPIISSQVIPLVKKTLAPTFDKSFGPEQYLIIKTKDAFDKGDISLSEKEIIQNFIGTIQAVDIGNKLTADNFRELEKLLFIILRTTDKENKKELKVKPEYFDLPFGFTRTKKGLIHFNFDKSKYLGRGNFKQSKYSVYLDLESATAYPSVYLRPRQQNDEATQNVQQEINVQSLFEHKNIVKVFDVVRYVDKNKNGVQKIGVYVEFCDGGTLEKGFSKCSQKERLELMHGCAAGLAYMHSLSMAHCDIKLDNLFIQTDILTGKKVGKVGDFGLTVPLVDSQGKPIPLTFSFLPTRPPEVQINCDKKEPSYATKEIDVFHFGLCLYKVFHKDLPLTSKGNPDVSDLDKLFKDWPSNVDVTIKDLARDCLNPDPSKRPTMEIVEKVLSKIIV